MKKPDHTLDLPHTPRSLEQETATNINISGSPENLPLAPRKNEVQTGRKGDIFDPSLLTPERINAEIEKVKAQPVGRLKNGNRSGNPNNAKRCNARSKRSGVQCQAPAIKGKSKCRMHGGRATGPKTDEGRKRSRNGNRKHGQYAAPLLKTERSFSATGYRYNIQIRDGLTRPEYLQLIESVKRWYKDDAAYRAAIIIHIEAKLQKA